MNVPVCLGGFARLWGDSKGCKNVHEGPGWAQNLYYGTHIAYFRGGFDEQNNSECMYYTLCSYEWPDNAAYKRD
jgi:hypothetical protein